MKKIFSLLCVLALVSSCNQKIEFDDFEYQSVYFPYQTPVRTVMLGDEVIGDNTIDLDHAFSIGLAIGGMYENDRDRDVAIELAPELAENITNGTDTLEILPSEYYTATFNTITIPEGSFFGKVRVELTDAFFQDPEAIDLKYVIPLRITDAFGDSILSGDPNATMESHDVRVKADWNIAPKNYTLFGIQYINPYHGMYLLRGQTINTSAAPQDTVFYSTRFLTQNSMVKLSTRSLTECVMPVVGGVNQAAQYKLMLTFDENAKNVTVSQFDGSTVAANGSGKYYTKDDDEAESYTEYKHRTIYLDYTYEDGGDTYHTNDSLVFLDTDVTFEEFELTVF
ncbi:MAG: DUF5627 domain-containing protein [Bacteroidales bacterium]|jgi:hypothetical protein|nr:DUF5627 domain-containing protein [Bacteroidales bacterium]